VCSVSRGNIPESWSVPPFNSGNHSFVPLRDAREGILRKVNKIALTALRLAASRKNNVVDEATMLDATQEAFL